MKRFALFFLILSAIPYIKTMAVEAPVAFLRNDTLTFKVDDISDETSITKDGGKIFQLNSGKEKPGWNSGNAIVRVVVFDVSFAKARPTSTYRWFWGMNKLSEICQLTNLNTSEVTDMHDMFLGCISLDSLNLSSFNTSNVTNMSSMFYGCSNMKSLNLSSFNTSNVTNMSSMFYGCSNMKSLNLSSFNTSNVTNMSSMFGGCSSLKNLNVGNLDLSKVSYRSSLFSGVGTIENPCVLAVGNQFDKTQLAPYIDNHAAHYKWHGGFFTLGDEVILSSEPIVAQNGEKLTFTRADRVSADDCWRLEDYSSPGNGIITTVVFDKSFAEARPTSTEYWFSGLNNLTTISGIENLNTSDVTNMHRMFNLCSSLDSLNLSSFNTSNVANMREMFNNCSSLKSLNISSFNMSNVTNMSSMFYGCSCLENLNIGNLDLSKVSSRGSIFSGVGTIDNPCELAVGNQFDKTQLAPYIDNHAAHYKWHGGYFTLGDEVILSSGPIVAQNGEKLTFTRADRISADDCWRLEDYSSPRNGIITTVVFDKPFAGARPTSTRDWFWDLKNLTTISGIENLNTSNVTDMHGMFHDCSSLESINLSNFNTSNVTDMSWMFGGCYSLDSLNVSNFNTRNVTDMSWMFGGCSSLDSLNLSGLNTSNVTTMSSMFHACGLKSLNLSGFNTSNVTYMGEMFRDCRSLDSLNLSGLNTSNVTSMYEMFNGCSSLKSLNLSGLNTSNVRYMDSMFYGCSSLDSLDLSGLNTSNVIDMSRMFGGCSSLKSLNLSGLNTSRVTSMSSMFYGCSCLDSLNLNGFNTSRVTNMSSMFYGCSSLDSLNVSNFKTDEVLGFGAMFYGCTGLSELDLSKFSFKSANTVEWMLYGCSGLKTLKMGSNSLTGITNTNSPFYGVGSASAPCKLVVNSDFDESVLGDLTEGNPSYYNWLSGYFTLEEVSTGIDKVKNSHKTTYDLNAPAYNLAGQRVGKDYKGVVIVGDKKYVRK